MWSQLFAGGIVSFLNFGIHALVTGIVIEATRHTANRTDHLHAFFRLTSLLTVTVTVAVLLIPPALAWTVAVPLLVGAVYIPELLLRVPTPVIVQA